MDVLDKAVKKSSKVLQDEAIWKQFLGQASYSSPATAFPAAIVQEAHSHIGRFVVPFLILDVVILQGFFLFLSLGEGSPRGKGKEFSRFLASLAAAGGRRVESALACLRIVWL